MPNHVFCLLQDDDVAQRDAPAAIIPTADAEYAGMMPTNKPDADDLELKLLISTLEASLLSFESQIDPFNNERKSVGQTICEHPSWLFVIMIVYLKTEPCFNASIIAKNVFA